MPHYQPAPAIRQGTQQVNLLTSADPLPDTVASYARWRTGLSWRSTTLIAAETQPADCSAVTWSDQNAAAIPEIDPFTVGIVHGCDGFVDEDEFRSEAVDALLDALGGSDG